MTNNRKRHDRKCIRRISAVLMLALIGAAACPEPTSAYFVENGRIHKTRDELVVLKGVNWFGFETSNHVVHGLWSRNWKSMIAQIKASGFNAVRLPVCPDTIDGAAATGIDYGINTDLSGLNGLEILDALIGEFNAQELYVLLDHHRPDCNAISELWYVDGYSEREWIDDLVFLARRYSGTDYFLGIDLKNEPHGRATWGTGAVATDWDGAAARAAAEIIAANPDILIFVEGIQENGSCSSSINHWWGGNLEPIECHPLDIQADKVVLSPHVYGPDVYRQPYFDAADFPDNMEPIWERHFGRFLDEGYTLAIGEFGGKYGHGGDPDDVAWQNALIDYLAGKGIIHSFYWSWNPNSGDTGGILQDDWQTVHQDKLDLLSRLWNTGIAGDPNPDTGTGTEAGNGGDSGAGSETETVNDPETRDTGDVPAATEEGVQTALTIQSDWSSGYCADVSVANTTDEQTEWLVTLENPGRITTLWNGSYTTSGDIVTVVGLTWNKTLAAGQTIRFGYCAERLATAPGKTEAPDRSVPGDVQTTVAVTTDWGGGYCAEVTVGNRSNQPVDWTAAFEAEGAVYNLWNAIYRQEGNRVTAEGVAWNDVIEPESTVTFGFCANR